MKSNLRTLLLFSFVIIFSSVAVYGAQIDVEVRKIWDTAPHSAFTDLIIFNGEFYCTFREGTGHIPTKKTGVGDGEIRVIKSKDGQNWESVVLLKKKGYDLRDSKISITPDGRLMLLMGGSVYVDGQIKARHPQVSFSDKNGENFSQPQMLNIDEKVRTNDDWVWRVTWYKGVGYGLVYRLLKSEPGQGTRLSAGLLKTENGIDYTSVTQFDIPASDAANEGTIRFDENGKMSILLRCEGGGKSVKNSGLFASSEFPYTKWDWKETGKRLGGPNFIFLPNKKIVIGSRAYDKGVATALYKINANGQMSELVRFPSSGDTSYPGMVVKDDSLWVSYYSGHEGKTSIYLARIPLEQIEKAVE